MINQDTIKHRLFLLILGLLLFAVMQTPLGAKESKTQTLLILTPYPQFITQVYQNSFKKHYPEIELEIVKKGTSKAVEYLLKNRHENIVDIFWASSPDTFNTLKSENILQRYKANTRGIPKIISGVQISDSDNSYTGYTLSGYGFMWNTRYLKIKDLPIPENWEDLADAIYYGHIGMSTPKQSGTTHVIIESILQTRGWENGWKLIKTIAGNAKELSKRSVHVPQKVQKGVYGIGIVIDYYALSSKAQHNPVDFSYPSPAILLPASAAIINNAPNKEAAKHFIDFLVSPQGQSLLLDKKSRRIPILPATFNEAPEDYPNPYEDKNLANTFSFDIDLSVKRYDLINTLFESLITNNFTQLSQLTHQIHQLEKTLKKKSNKEAEQLLEQAKTELMWLPEVTSQPPNNKIASSLQKSWEDKTKQQYRQANELAQLGLSILEN